MGAEEACKAMMTQRATASQFPACEYHRPGDDKLVFAMLILQGLLMVVLSWLELALGACGMSTLVSFWWMPLADQSTASIINIVLVVIAVTSRNTISVGVLAVALSQAAGLCNDLISLIVEWTSKLSSSANTPFPPTKTCRRRDVHHVRRAYPRVLRAASTREETANRGRMATARLYPIHRLDRTISAGLATSDQQSQFHHQARPTSWDLRTKWIGQEYSLGSALAIDRI